MKLYKKGHVFTPEEIEENIRAAVASSRLEGIYTPPEEISLLRDYMLGKIAREDYNAAILGKAGSRDEP